jgi:isoquinoline 1-oxidoreductase subunit beta
VHFIDNGFNTIGLGEPALQPLSGAIANALYKVTGKRFHTQPFFSDNNALLQQFPLWKK